jgi:2-methylisocitrate lyase-like PEP mutase family enzyme
MSTSQAERAATFRQLHTNRPLVLPNAWDAASARVIEAAGALGIATTSAGVSWSYGRSDGQTLAREEMLEATQRITQTVAIPVTADVEGGYGDGSATDVAETVRALVAIGAAGMNIEDSPGRDGQTLLSPEAHAERLHAARAAAHATGGDLVINARTDIYLLAVGEPETRLVEAARRGNLYLAAGADCVFVPGVIDADTIAALARAIHGPVNILAGPGAPSAPELGRLGVARVSVGAVITLAALALTRRAASELIEQGTYSALVDALPFGEVNDLFARASR